MVKAGLKFTAFLSEQIGEPPLNLDIYKTAFVHPSLDGEDDYQRLEFLGDAVLNLAVTHILFEDHSCMDEGFLTRERMSLVRKEVLSRMSEIMGFKEFIRLGKGEETDMGREKESILSDVFESFIAALYMDKGFTFVLGWVRGHIDLFKAAREGIKDYKSLLQELIQGSKQSLPRYRVVREDGAAHKKTFFVELYSGEIKLAEGKGHTKKAAEQDAAQKAYAVLIKE